MSTQVFPSVRPARIPLGPEATDSSPPSSGTDVKIDGEDLLIMKESDVMGIIEGKAVTRRKAA